MKFVIIIYLVSDWETFHRRPMLQSLAKNLKGIAKILCINPRVCVPTSLIQTSRRKQIFRKLFSRGLQKISFNLYVFTPCIWIHESICDIFRVNNPWIISNQIKKALNMITDVTLPKISWVYRPEQIRWLGLIEEDIRVYECYDEFCYTANGGIFQPEVERNENDLLQQVDIVFTTSEPLYQSRGKKHSKVFLAPNGVNFELFSMANNDLLSIPAELKKIKQPRIGYIGSMYSKSFVDLDLLDYATAIHLDWSFVFIGTTDNSKAIRALRKKSNVHFLGKKQYERLPKFLKWLDVMITPFHINKFIDSVNPLTLWENLAAGKKIVSTNFEMARKLSQIVLVAKSKKEFISSIDFALKNECENRVKEGINLAKGNTWEIATKKMWEILYRELLKDSKLK